MKDYDEFVTCIEGKYPKMFAKKYGGIAVGEGWWPIIESLCANMQSHIDFVETQRDWAIKNNTEVPASVPQIVVAQIKEKFGGLRFYHEGGDAEIRGMVRMAEAWADHSCETCGEPGKRGGTGWLQTLCSAHREEIEGKNAAYAKENGLDH